MRPTPAPRLRSLLFAPAVRADLIPKLTRSEPDGVIIDCEDATPVGQKAEGRSNAMEFTPRLLGQGARVFVRVNAPNTPWFRDDIAYGLHDQLAGVIVPMIESTGSLDLCAKTLSANDLGHLGIIIGLETALGVADARELMGHPQVIGAYFGAEDFVADMGGVRTTNNVEVHHARSAVVLAARLASKPAFDQIVANFKDGERYQREAAEARAMGFKGKLCIHPGQVALANAGFTPSEEEVDRAIRLLAAYEIGVASGVAAIDFEGVMVDGPLAIQARNTLIAAGIDPENG